MGEGPETLIAISTDAAGNPSEGREDVTVDTMINAPTFTNPTAIFGSDNTINAAERAAVQTISVRTDDDVNEVILCFGGTTVSCTGGTDYTATDSSGGAGTDWSYDLTTDNITALLLASDLIEGDTSDLLIIATDEAGNSAVSATAEITVDTGVPNPPVINVVATDDIINLAEQGSDITGTTETGTRVSVCFAGTGAACNSGLSRGAFVTGTTWSYTLVPTDIAELEQGENKRLTAYATDDAGNTSPAGDTSPAGIRIITVDTIPPVFNGGDTVPINISTDTAEAYDAEATDASGDSEGNGLTYTLSGIDAGTFSINADNGVVTYSTAPTDEVDHQIIITVFDAAGNTAMQTVNIMVREGLTVTITDDIVVNMPLTRTADIAGTVDGKVTFTFVFSDPVSDFMKNDITVGGGGTPVTLTGTAGARTYTLDVNLPTSPNNAGVMTVTVAANTVTVTSGTEMNAAVTTHEQRYDTVAPVNTLIDEPDDNTLVNAAELADGVTVSGTNEGGVSVVLCVDATDATATTCDGGDPYKDQDTATATWSYMLGSTELTTESEVRLTAIATDAAGNTAVSPERTITVDITPPDAPMFVDVSDGIITAAERTAGVTPHRCPGRRRCDRRNPLHRHRQRHLRYDPPPHD